MTKKIERTAVGQESGRIFSHFKEKNNVVAEGNATPRRGGKIAADLESWVMTDKRQTQSGLMYLVRE